MKYLVSGRSALLPTLSFSALMFLGNPGVADVLHFRVAFENVPGAAEIEAGNLAAGIKVIKERLHRDGSENRGAMLATLCAAYIINDSLHKAEHACNQAVETEPTAAAYNNRGVFRASIGDYFGARVDFRRVQPRQLESYFEELKKSDPSLIAAGNFRLIDALMTKHSAVATNPVLAIKTATIEDLSH